MLFLIIQYYYDADRHFMRSVIISMANWQGDKMPIIGRVRKGLASVIFQKKDFFVIGYL